MGYGIVFPKAEKNAGRSRGCQEKQCVEPVVFNPPDLDKRIERMEKRATKEGIKKPANTKK